MTAKKKKSKINNTKVLPMKQYALLLPLMVVMLFAFTACGENRSSVVAIGLGGSRYSYVGVVQH